MIAWRARARDHLRRLAGRPVFPDYHYFAARSATVACCAIPKNACTALKYWMLWLDGCSTAGLGHGHVHPLASDRLGISPRRLEALRSRGRCFMFTFIRNPWRRLASAYLDKFVAAGGLTPITLGIVEMVQLRGKPASRARRVRLRIDPATGLVAHTDPRVDYDRGISFEEFVSYAESQPDHALDDHWRPQWQFLEGRRFDRIARFESFLPELADIARHIGATARLPEPPPEIARLPSSLDLSREPSGALCTMKAMPAAANLLRGDLVQRIAVRYARDIEQLGYHRGPEV